MCFAIDVAISFKSDSQIGGKTKIYFNYETRCQEFCEYHLTML